MNNWQKKLKYEPTNVLLNSSVEAVRFATKKFLLNEKVDYRLLWNTSEPQKIIEKQKKDGSWNYKNPPQNNIDYQQYQAFLNLAELVEKYGLNKQSESVTRAANYLLSFQTEKGDIRGIYGKQYSPNYTAAIIEILIKTGYGKRPEIAKSFEWLLSSRQDDGGWALPFRTRGYNLDAIYSSNEVYELESTKPSSVMITGVVLRAFACSGKYKQDKDILRAAHLLEQGLFVQDHYPDRKAGKYWFQFTYPFIYTDLISAMDTLSLLGIKPESEEITRALDWFRHNQKPVGTWDLKVTRGREKEKTKQWLSIAISRVFKRFFS